MEASRNRAYLNLSPDATRDPTSISLAGAAQIRIAVVVTTSLAAATVLASFFAVRPMPPVVAVVAVQQSMMVVIDLVVTALLSAQFIISRSMPLLLLAGGYAFAGFMSVAHGLAVRGLFSPEGLLGVGGGGASWLYVIWHGGFPLAVTLYSLMAGRARPALARTPARRPALAILTAVVVALMVAYGATLAVMLTKNVLPPLVIGNRTTPSSTVAAGVVCLLCLIALAALGRRRPRSVIDLWLMVTMCAWMGDVLMFLVFSTHRFDLGWYVGRLLGLVAACFLLFVLLLESAAQQRHLTEMSESLRATNQVLERLSLHDELTGLVNRRGFDTYLASQMAVMHREKRSLILVLFDVDAFKGYNDHYGHLAGDECLVRVAAALRSCCRRPADMAARYGGEEFALILPETGLAGGLRIAEAAREAVAALAIPHAHSPAAPHVTISGGVAMLTGYIPQTAEQLIAEADQNLFHAKSQGRNRVICAPASSGGAPSVILGRRALGPRSL